MGILSRLNHVIKQCCKINKLIFSLGGAKSLKKRNILKVKYLTILVSSSILRYLFFEIDLLNRRASSPKWPYFLTFLLQSYRLEGIALYRFPKYAVAHDNLSKNIDQNSFICCLLIHLSKAFDSVDQKILVQKRENHFGILGVVCELFKSHISFIASNTKVKNASSSS